MRQSDLDAADWLDLLHHYLIDSSPPHTHQELHRALSGPVRDARSEEAKRLLPPAPAWSRIPAADIERMARLRAQQKVAATQAPATT